MTTIYMPEPEPELEVQTTLTQDFADILCPGGWIGAHLNWACQTTHAPPVLHVMTSLAFAAFELARRGWWLEGVASNYKAPFLWVAVIADSGEGKGAAISRIRLLDKLAATQMPSMFVDGRCGDEGALFPVRGSASGVLADLENRIYADGRGGERTCGFLVNDEFHIVLELAKRNPEFASNLIEAHDQLTLIFRQRGIQKEEDGERKGSLPNPALSTVFVSTKEQLTDVFTERLLHGGFSSRFLWIAPRNWTTFWPIEPNLRLPMGEAVAAQYVRWVERIGGDRKPENCRVIFPQEGEVLEAHRSWSLELHNRHPRGTPNRSLYVPRLAHATALMACIIAAVESEGLPFNAPITVEAPHYTRARNLAVESYQSIPTLISLTRTGDVRQDDDLIMLAQRMGRKGITAKDAARQVNKDLPRVYAALRAAEQLQLLVALGVRTGGVGRPSVVWWAAEHAPPVSLRKPSPSGAETIEGTWALRWGRGESLQTILSTAQ